MLKIAVNPSLFVTCRLCLEDLGLYQIIPAVKEKILYCFDIHVELFDGLPQLICKKCEEILSTYTAIKKKFIEKQNGLKNKLQESNSVKLSNDQPKTKGSTNGDLKSGNLNLGTGGKGIASTSSCDLELEQPSKVKRFENYNNSSTDISVTWLERYKKNYVCRFCNSRWLKIESLKCHINSRHSLLMHKYRHVFKKHCEVKLNKTDGKHNITGTCSKVMLTRNKIIENINPTYYITYTTKDSIDDEELSDSNDSLKTTRCYKSSNVSDDDDYVVVSKKRKPGFRLCSRSSNETVVLDTNNSNTSDNFKESCNSPYVPIPIEVAECIQIDDSSDDESENSKNLSKRKSEKQIPVINDTINEVITSSCNKYKRKHQENLLIKSSKKPSEIATQLKRKILSIGRKTINKKKNFNCTPFLKFMEHKNVDTAWNQRVVKYLSLDSDYIRIMPTLKNIEENSNSETGWTDYSTSNKFFAQSFPSANCLEVSQSNKVNNGIQGTVKAVSVPEIELAKSAESIGDANLIGADIKKLLNANPVANPKQLPKKPAPTEPKTVINPNPTKSSNDTNTVKVITTKQPIPNTITLQMDNNLKFYMPVIASTSSLAGSRIIHENDNVSSNPVIINIKNDTKTSDAPRIKVKPVSELMSLETLSRMQEPVGISCMVTSHQSNMTICAPESPPRQNEFMILHTIQLPHTKTNSPFQYFKRLLQLHNITLLDTDTELSSDFHCLVKFKVQYKQATNNPPVVLCIAIFCSQNVFCFQVKDRNQVNLNISTVSPNWQWEVLKINKGDVVNKLLSNARKIGTDVYEFTNSFLCLLKSIEVVNI